MSTDHSPALLHLMQLVSPALPVGAYAYSQGLESAVENKWVVDAASAESWLRGSLTHGLGFLDAPVFLRVFDALQNGDQNLAQKWNQFLQGSRESSELLLEDTQMGAALLRLLNDLQVTLASVWDIAQTISFATAFAMASVHWRIEKQTALQGFIWSWLENQTAAAIKLVPLGQTQGQQLLLALMNDIQYTANKAKTLRDDELGWSLPRVAMASMNHETQYSRLFRS